MSLEGRPQAGTWRLNNRKTVKVTPDCLVYFNGDTSVAGCASCSGRIDLQKYITQVSVDPSTEGPTSASISMHIPKSSGDGLYQDGQLVLHPGLEVHVYFRGYFAVQGLTSGVDPATTSGVDVRNSVMYPYYLVFHGVVTEVSSEYGGGEHTVSMSCADMLHFWQYQRMSTQGSLFGARPTNSKVKMSLLGHNFTGMSPFGIVYQLFRDVQGSAGGVEFALGNQTNAAANSTVVGESLFSLSILYWQKRFAQSTTSLRMYGADGTLYNAFQAAYLSSLKSEDPAKLANKYGSKNSQSHEVDPMVRASKITGFDPFSVGLGSSGSISGGDGSLGVNVSQLQAFTSDISQWGSVNLFESQYMTKLEVANTVKEACGYEFYQDVDGDIVFKPPFYNLDTSESRVYRIEAIDIISFSSSSKEPEATVVKATGGHFRNLTGTGLENSEWGTRAEFIDYRLVAKFGWRQAPPFETAYHTDSQAMFFACVARFDIFNIGMHSASCTIPMRPELRPGYPVYIVPLDCFYYLHSLSHSFSFGGTCTTSLNLVGKRAKFYAPGQPPLDGRPVTVEDIRLNNMHLPALPIQIDEVDGTSVVPRLQGFPNVVMTIDTELINPLSFAQGIDVADLQSEDAIRSLIDQAKSGRLSVLQEHEDGDGDEHTACHDGPWQIQTGQDTPPVIIPGINELLAQARKIKDAYDGNGDLMAVEAEAAPLLALVEAARDTHSKMFPDAESSATYLEVLSDVKAAYNPGASLPGYYRYYSSSHPDVAMQGPVSWSVDSNGVIKTGTQTPLDPSVSQTASQFAITSGGGNTMVTDGVVKAGIPILKSGSRSQTVSTPTHQITTLQMAHFTVDENGTRTVVSSSKASSFPNSALASALAKYFKEGMVGVPAQPEDQVGDLFYELFDTVAHKVGELVGVYPEMPRRFDAFSTVPGDKLHTIASEMGSACADVAGSALTSKLRSVNPVPDGTTSSRFGKRSAPKEGASTEHQGEDIAAPVGTPIYAVLEGVVRFAAPRGNYGNLLIIEHPDGNFTRYAHCDQILVSVGQSVVAGEQVATVGKSGNVTGPHLHFEVRTSSGVAIDPSSYLESLGAANVRDLDAAWASLWPLGSKVVGGTGKVSVTVPQKHTKEYTVPVFPVSDERGYEVVGTFRYGRGLTVSQLDEMSGFVASTTADYESVEEFLRTITEDSSKSALSVAIGNLSPSMRATLASRTMSEDVADVLGLSDPGGTQTQLGGMNFPANSKEFAQKNTLTNAAYNLADIKASAGQREVCSCRGAEADALLLAFDSSFVTIGTETEQIQDWLTDQNSLAGNAWAARQAAYRGETVESTPSTYDAAAAALAALRPEGGR